MDITPTISSDAKVIQSYGPEGFLISHVIYRRPVIVTATHVLEWSIGDLAGLTAADFQPILDAGLDIETILLGCGAGGMQIKSAVRAELKAMGFSIDAMPTGAACRTYNVMLSEERRIAAAIVPG